MISSKRIRLFVFAFLLIILQPVFSQEEIILAGTDKGLFDVSSSSPKMLWDKGGVQSVVKGNKWYFLTTEGIYASSDLKTFISCNEGLPFSIIKKYDGKQKSFIKQTQQLKDIAVDPENPNTIVTATKNAVFLSQDGGISWTNLGFSSNTNGLKSVAVATLPNDTGVKELCVIMTHSIYGVSYIKPLSKSPKWLDLDRGFELQETTNLVDEVADVLPVLEKDEFGNTKIELYASQTFRPRLYRINWANKRSELIWQGDEPADTVEALCAVNGNILFTRPNELVEFNSDTKNVTKANYTGKYISKMQKASGNLQCGAVIYSANSVPLILGELWLLTPEKITSKYISQMDKKAGLYIPVWQITTDSGLNKFLKIIKDNNLDLAVMDMKDDYGYLRYNSKDPVILKKASISQYNINLDKVIPKMKENGVYLVARIVAFKDLNLARYGNKKYAVWNYRTKNAWTGIKNYVKNKNEEGEVISTTAEYYDEAWVDPYSEEVWEYNVSIAKELISRGFDEVQFDYIRFPTDGLNLNEASFRWRDEGMDKESALMSFLSYARENIDAPIGIDIYGANGWYRTGARTGQEVELMARYVDVICPMFYPSHFEQTLLAQNPAAERPYRIYYYGSYRNAVIARNKILVRPWTQAFYLGVSYDYKYYNADYVERQLYGVRDATNHGYMHWNNSGNYSTIRPNITDDSVYPWNAKESSPKYRKPALGGK